MTSTIEQLHAYQRVSPARHRALRNDGNLVIAEMIVKLFAQAGREALLVRHHGAERYSILLEGEPTPDGRRFVDVGDYVVFSENILARGEPLNPDYPQSGRKAVWHIDIWSAEAFERLYAREQA